MLVESVNEIKAGRILRVVSTTVKVRGLLLASLAAGRTYYKVLHY